MSEVYDVRVENPKKDPEMTPLVLKACAESLNGWVKTVGLKEARQQLKRVLRYVLYKRGDPDFEQIEAESCGTDRTSCQQCLINYHNCKKTPAECYAAYVACSNGPQKTSFGRRCHQGTFI